MEAVVPLCPRGVEPGVLRRLPPKPWTGGLKAKPFRGKKMIPMRARLKCRLFVWDDLEPQGRRMGARTRTRAHERLSHFRNPVEQEQLILRSTRHRLPGPAATFAITVAVLTLDSRRTCRHAFFLEGLKPVSWPRCGILDDLEWGKDESSSNP